MGVKTIVKRIGAKAGDKVAKLSALSPEQVQEIQLKREEYLLEKPAPDDEVARVCTERMMAASSVEIFHAYLPQIRELYLPVKKDAEYERPFDAGHNVRYFNITKWVVDKKENSLEKLVNVYAVLSNEDCNIALVFHRMQRNTDVYLAVVNRENADNNTNVNAFKERLEEAVRGNFPGAEWKNGGVYEGIGMIPYLRNDKDYSVASASNIPTEKSEKFISQTIEKLLDGIIPNTNKTEYTLILLATPIQDVEDRKLKLGEFYSGLAPYATWQTSFQFTENSAAGSGATVGVNIGASAGIQNGQNYSMTDTDSVSANSAKTETESRNDTIAESRAEAESNSSAHTDATNRNETKSHNVNESYGTNSAVSNGENHSQGSSATVSVNGEAGVDIFGIKASGGGGLSGTASVTDGTSFSVTNGESYNQSVGKSIAESLGKTASDTLTKGLTKTISNSVSQTTGTAVANTLGKAVTKAMSKTAGTAKNVSFGGNFGANFARSSTVTATVGKNEGITQSFTNFNIKHALELLENQMKRLEQSTALGMWDFAAYVLSEDPNVANNVAHTYLALTLGEESYMSKSAINLWRGNVEEEKVLAKEICGYLKEFRHPVFCLNPGIVEADPGSVIVNEDKNPEDLSFITYPPIVTATTSLSGKELAYSLNFPQKSIAGLPILECAEFGRNVVTYDCTDAGEEKIELGNIFHMNHVEKNQVALSKKSLASHTFITGSTGSGKSNTVYQILTKLIKEKVKFLVVEPAKGEYKNIFGNDKEVSVYGTNPAAMPLLRINPFSFPKTIHVLEHLDRLIEIFNVCWPMYAAMPAVLKSAVEKSYTDCGWDLIRSLNQYENDLYPTFSDVADNIKYIIDSSEYDNENKGAYKGSLLTRLQSLTNGINGLIFLSDEISDSELFDENVIVDLSRVGSSETKALIMGMLVLKLQEYRMTGMNGMNSGLKHVTVLEEAHNILRRTSTEQSAEGANMLGKSVEMLANAIAEMRTYGEGFIIADQAPGLMDMSVIRNTNTKIIMRLPAQTDRELVGKAANLNEDQIAELAKLPCGVAAVYQNEWVQAVLCKVEKFEAGVAAYQFMGEDNDALLKKDRELSELLLKYIMDRELFQIGDREDIRELKGVIIRSKLRSTVKISFLDYMQVEQNKRIEALKSLVYNFLEADKAVKTSGQHGDICEWINAVIDKLNPSIRDYSTKQIDLLMALILQEQMIRDASYRDIFICFTEVHRSGGRIF